MTILIAGPYRSGTGGDPQRIAENLARLEEAAWPIFRAGHVPMILDGVGLMGEGGHTVKETADLTTLPSQTKRAALMLYRLSR